MAIFDKTLGKIKGLGLSATLAAERSFDGWQAARNGGVEYSRLRNYAFNPVSIGAASGAAGAGAATAWQNRDGRRRSVIGRAAAGGLAGAALGAGYMYGRYGRKPPPATAKQAATFTGEFDEAAASAAFGG